jgi:hypothetical protein
MQQKGVSGTNIRPFALSRKTGRLEEALMAGERDPRSEAEKARADLKRNAEMGSSIPMSPVTRQPSVTPETFGEHGAKPRALSGTDQGLEAGGVRPAVEGGAASESIVEAEQLTTGRDSTEAAASKGTTKSKT